MPRRRPRFVACLAALLEILPAGAGQCAVHDALVFPRVVTATGCGLVRKLFGTYEIPAPEFDTVHAELSGCFFHQSLDQVGSLRPAGTAVGVDGYRIGHDQVYVDKNGGNRINTCRHAGAEPGNDRTGLGAVRSDVGVDGCLHGKKSPVSIQRQFRMARMVTSVQIRQETFGTIGNPLHGPFVCPAREHGDHRFALQEELEAETAADIRCDHPQFVGLDVHRFQDLAAQGICALASLVHGNLAACGIVVDVAAARLHCGRCKPVVQDIDGDDMRCAGKDCVGRFAVAISESAETVTGHTLVNHRGTFVQCIGRRNHCYEFVDFEFNQLRSTFRVGQRFREHGRDRFAHVTNPLANERWLLQRGARSADGKRQQRGSRHVAYACRSEILRGINGDDARRRASRCNVQSVDLAMCIRRTKEVKVCLVGEMKVARVATGASYESLVLPAAYCLSCAEFTHAVSLFDQGIASA